MNYIIHNNEVEVTCVRDFDLVKTFECGQCFRWETDEKGIYTGITRGHVAGLRSEGDSVFIYCAVDDFESVWYDYFDLDRDYPEIRRRLSSDGFMREVSDFGAGIRILRQDGWEALCSFIISQCNNIPRIKKIIAALCREFGESSDFMGRKYFAFPSADKLAALEEGDLAPLRCGYRAAYIIGAAKAVASGALDLSALAKTDPGYARTALKRLQGVGDKVADCVILYGLHMLDAFPLDVWMKRAVAEHYGPGFDPSVFSPYAGIAQQYIYYYARNTKSEKINKEEK